MRPHLIFRNPVLGVERFRQNSRFIGEDPDDEEKNYEPMKKTFAQCRETFFAERDARIRKRNSALKVPVHIEYIVLRFFSSFNSKIFENYYRRTFGLVFFGMIRKVSSIV